MAGGRPSEYDPAFCEKVIEIGKTGASVVEMAAEIGVDRATIERHWPEAHPEFFQAFTKAKILSQAWWEKVGREGMFESPGGVKINPSIWSRSMAARFPHDWRENSKVENTHANPDGSPLSLMAQISGAAIVPKPSKE